MEPYYKGKSPLTERFVHAFRGIWYAWQKEPNFRIEAFIAVGVLAAMIILPLHGLERAVLVLIITFVLALEVINSLFERMLDLIHPHFSPEVKRIKDTMAGAVLLAATAAVIIAGLILVRPLLLFDFTLQEFLIPFRTSFGIGFARIVTLLGGWQVIVGVGGLMSLILLVRQHYKHFTLLAGGLLGGELIVLLLKFLFSRPRPEAVEWVQAYGSSFPSGHVFLGTVLWLIVAYILTASETRRRYIWVMASTVIAFVVVSRIILSVHWFSDVVGGLLLGMFWFFFWFGLNEKLHEKESSSLPTF